MHKNNAKPHRARVRLLAIAAGKDLREWLEQLSNHGNNK